jgi:hypothetical protein
VAKFIRASNSHYPRVKYVPYFFYDHEEKLINKFLLDKLKLTFAVSFEIIIQRAVGNESCYTIKNTLIITVLSNRSIKKIIHVIKKIVVIYIQIKIKS